MVTLPKVYLNNKLTFPKFDTQSLKHKNLNIAETNTLNSAEVFDSPRNVPNNYSFTRS